MNVIRMNNFRINYIYFIIFMACFFWTSAVFNEECEPTIPYTFQRSNTHFNRQILLPLNQTNENMVIAWNKKPSRTKAFFLSLLIPGAGEYYLGSKKRALTFLGIEVGLWAGYLALKGYGSWIEQDYQLYAVRHASIDRRGKDHEYYVDIGNFDDLTQYNEEKLRQRDINSLYPDTDKFLWKWDKTLSREKYRDMRVKSDQIYQSALFVIGGIFINHVVSSLDALRLAKKQKKLSSRPLYLAMTGLREGGYRIFLFKSF